MLGSTPRVRDQLDDDEDMNDVMGVGLMLNRTQQEIDEDFRDEDDQFYKEEGPFEDPDEEEEEPEGEELEAQQSQRRLGSRAMLGDGGVSQGREDAEAEEFEEAEDGEYEEAEEGEDGGWMNAKEEEVAEVQGGEEGERTLFFIGMISPKFCWEGSGG